MSAKPKDPTSDLAPQDPASLLGSMKYDLVLSSLSKPNRVLEDFFMQMVTKDELQRQQKAAREAAKQAAQPAAPPSPAKNFGPCMSPRRPLAHKGATDILHLNESEIDWTLMLCSSITTMTVYTGDPPLHFLRNRMREIVQVNPWLAGRMITQGGKTVVEYLKEPDDDTINKLFKYASGSLRAGMDYREMEQVVTPFIVQCGNDCLNVDEPLFKVVVLSSTVTDGGTTEAQRFSFLISLSHLLGDGATYYQLYKQFSEDALHVSPLTAIRTPHQHDLRDPSGQVAANAFAWYKLPVSFMSLHVKAKLMPSHYKRRVSLHIVKDEWIEQQKEQHKAEKEKDPNMAPFVSSNDLLTCWFWQLCRCDIGFINVNIRNRLEEYTDMLAGNYHFLIWHVNGVHATDYKYSASYLRHTLTKLAGDALRNPPVMENSTYRHYTSNWHSVGITSNWAGIYKPLKLKKHGCEQVTHLPIFDTSRQGPITMLIIFCPLPGKLGTMVIDCSPEQNTKFKSSDDEPRGEPII